jgi:glycosyltransferase involved in cell wall biosynthesis
VAVVIPCFRVRRHILDVLKAIGPEVDRVYVVDDKCPEGTGRFVQDLCRDPRVSVLFQPVNQGVGGAVMAGYRAALREGAEIVVKLDGDGQMDPAHIPRLLRPIRRGEADYAKGNRFFDGGKPRAMPRVRFWGNAALSFMAKWSTGYRDLVDPTNGYTAIHAGLVARLPLDKISRGYFFETDMLFRLNLLDAVVVDVPIDAHYRGETSSLRISRVAGEFLLKHLQNGLKRLCRRVVRPASVAPRGGPVPLHRRIRDADGSAAETP